MAREFHDLLQTIEIVAEITAKFRERTLLVPQYAADEEMKKMRFHDMLWDDIREFLSLSSCKTSDDMISRAREREIDLQLWSKRRPKQIQTVVRQEKRPRLRIHDREAIRRSTVRGWRADQ